MPLEVRRRLFITPDNAITLPTRNPTGRDTVDGACTFSTGFAVARW
ncbi:MAG TPA: hypothetical protein VIG48_11390 [Jatrophihabitans sp.]